MDDIFLYPFQTYVLCIRFVCNFDVLTVTGHNFLAHFACLFKVLYELSVPHNFLDYLRLLLRKTHKVGRKSIHHDVGLLL